MMEPFATQAPRGLAAAPRGRIAVAMSGGVDSSVAAALLVEQGWDVVGVHMKLAGVPDAGARNRSCCSLDDAMDARQVCARLGIPFYVLDFTAEFHGSVISYFVESYRAGRTPNPCVMCNRTVKNALLLERVREFGCSFLATGHYAGIRQNPETGAFEIVTPRDRRKDQTYFLWGTPREELPWLRFPLADYDKPQARQVAARHQFITWDKPDSQEVCFVPGDYRDFLKPRLMDAPPPKGDFVDRRGRVLGRHEGLPYYTVGQRRGIGIAAARPLYVVALRPERNQVVLGPVEELYQDSARLSGVNWVSCPEPAAPVEAVVKVRYAHEGTPAVIEPAGPGTAVVRFRSPVRAVAPGQAAVFYAGDVLLGGGWIEP
jgi:tRNA-specific 2-thiouridylase